MKMTHDFSFDPKEIRRRLGLNQQDFWTRIGVSQSAGSRYESGRRMPKPVRELLRVVHIERIDPPQVHRMDFDILDYLKARRPDVYQSLRREIGADALETSVSAPLSESPDRELPHPVLLLSPQSGGTPPRPW